MFSLNAPVPPAVRRLRSDLASDLAGFDVRPDPTLVVKRLGDPDPEAVHGVEKRARQAVSGAPACEARVSEVGVFRDPPGGPAPVVYLAVESPGLERLHDRLCTVFDPASGVEGDDYVPHVTLARGGDPDAAERLDGRAVGPVSWTVDELEFYDARHGEVAGRVSLPA